ncbi:MAG: cyclic nucleotide-binding domain-containing protein [Spirochaetaceae bacterium]
MLDLKGSYTPYFRELDDSQIKEIEKISTTYQCQSGDIIYLQGEYCQNWVIINSGNFMTRETVDGVVIEEKILLEGQSFDFESTIKNSITSRSLEALGDSSIVVISTLGLKKISKKNPIISSLIKSSLGEYKSIWENYISKSKSRIESVSYRIKKSLLSVLISSIPLLLMFSLIDFVIFMVFLNGLNFVFFVSLIIIGVFIFLITLVNSRLTFIELNREQIVKREFSVKKISSQYDSIPIEKIQSTSVLYNNRFFRLFRIGEVVIESPTNKISIDGVFRPESVISDISDYTKFTVFIDKAIELASFKLLFSKDKGLFYIESNLERDENSIFTFRKSIVYLLARSLPPFLIFLFSSIGLYVLFQEPRIFYINIPTLILLLWNYRDWGNDKYSFEGDKIIDIEKKPLWGKEIRIEADITSVMSIKKEQKHFLQLLFNYGDIEVDTFGGKIVYPSIYNPDKVIDNLYVVKKYFYSKKENREKIQRQEEFINFTKYYQELTKE